MKNENEKKGLFERLTGIKKEKKSSCCCKLEIEELPADNTDNKNSKDSSKLNKKPCCK